MDRCHLEHSTPEDPEAEDLDDDREGLDDEQATDDHQQQVEVHEQAHRSESRPDRERSGVTHVDLRRRRVPPQEAKARPSQRDGGQAEVERRPQVVDGEVSELPVADDGKDREAERRRASGQPIETIGEVHGVRRADDHKHRQDDPARLAELPARQRGAGHREGGRRVDPEDCEHGEDGAEQELQERLRPLVQAETPAVPDLGDVIEEADEPETRDCETHERTGPRQSDVGPHVAEQKSDDHRSHDHDATHRGSAGFDRM